MKKRKGPPERMIWEIVPPLPRAVSADAWSTPHPEFVQSYIANRVVKEILRKLGFLTPETEVTREGIEFLSRIGDWMPVNKSETFDLWNLAESGLPSTELFWRWASAISEANRRQQADRANKDNPLIQSTP